MVIACVDPQKDVDGLHPLNAGRIASGLPALAPCASLAWMSLTKSVHASLEGMKAIVISRSTRVGRPLAQMLLNGNVMVTIAHSRSHDLPQLCAGADLVYSAIGRPEVVRGAWTKPGATVVDVGICVVQKSDGVARLKGDVALQAAWKVAGESTPVPGGVGPVTVACLLANTVGAACAIRGLPPPSILDDCLVRPLS